MEVLELKLSKMEKFRLIRDGQIVGYKLVDGTVTQYSYEGRDWFAQGFPYSQEQPLLGYDSDNLVEVYEEKGEIKKEKEKPFKRNLNPKIKPVK